MLFQPSLNLGKARTVQSMKVVLPKKAVSLLPVTNTLLTVPNNKSQRKSSVERMSQELQIIHVPNPSFSHYLTNGPNKQECFIT